MCNSGPVDQNLHPLHLHLPPSGWAWGGQRRPFQPGEVPGRLCPHHHMSAHTSGPRPSWKLITLPKKEGGDGRGGWGEGERKSCFQFATPHLLPLQSEGWEGKGAVWNLKRHPNLPPPSVEIHNLFHSLSCSPSLSVTPLPYSFTPPPRPPSRSLSPSLSFLLPIHLSFSSNPPHFKKNIYMTLLCAWLLAQWVRAIPCSPFAPGTIWVLNPGREPYRRANFLWK